MNDFVAGLFILISLITGADFSSNEQELGSFSDPFVSIQLATNPSNGNCLTTDGTNNSWSSSCGSAGGGGGGGTWSTTTSQVSGRLINYPSNATDIVVIGSNATTSAEFYYDPNTTSLFALVSSSTLMGNSTTTGMQGVGSLYINNERFTDLTGSGLVNTSNTLAVSAGVANLSSADFGSWTCNGVACTIDSQAVTATMLENADFGNFTVAGGVTTIDNGSVTNAMLANSTISGIALGSNLGDLTAGNSSLTFSGTYNGSTARNIVLNVGNANVWTALQSFANSTTTLADIFSLRVGRTASTTIGSDGSITMPSGSTFTKTGVTDGCATWASGVLGTTGSACGSGGGGGIQDPFTHPTVTSSATTSLMLFNGQASSTQFSAYKAFFGGTATTTIASNGFIGFASSTPAFPLSIEAGALTTAVAFVSNIDNYSQFLAWNKNSGTTASTDYVAANDKSCPDAACGYYVDLGINSSTYSNATYSSTGPGDSYLYANDDNLVIGTASTTDLTASLLFATGGFTTAHERMRINRNGYIGMGTTTPNFALLTLASSTAPQLSLSVGGGFAQWVFRNANGNLYVSTTTIAGTATSTPSALSILNSGFPSLGIGSTTFNGVLGLGTGNSTNASSTISGGKLQWDGYDSAGGRRCVFINSSGSIVVQSGGCN